MRVKYSFGDNTDYKHPVKNLTKGELLRIVKRMSNKHNWGNLYGYHIQGTDGNNYTITTTKAGQPNDIEIRG